MQLRGRIQGLESRAKHNPFLVILFFVATFLSAVIVLGAAGLGISQWYERHFDWRDHEYDKLIALHAGFTRHKFEEVLGRPVFDRVSKDGRFREQTFQRREYWVQTVSDREDTVQLYSVTACGLKFRPRFAIPGAVQAEQSEAEVELNVSTFAGVMTRAPRIDYFGSGATANSRFLDILEGGNPSNYKTFLWGLNDVCDGWFGFYESLYHRELLPQRRSAIFKGPLTRAPPWTERFRQDVIVNTYAETAPLFYLRDLRGAFQVGADRILTRTVTKP